MLNYYLHKAIWPMLIVLAASLVALLAALSIVSAIETRRGHIGVFEVELRRLGDAPLWILIVAGMLLVNGVVMTRWAVATADVGQRRAGHGYELNIPFPIGKIVASNVFYIGAAILGFFVLRSLA